jgi:hypothetical protein
MNRSRHTRERTWTPAEEADLRAWYGDGLDFDTIGRRLNRGPMGVRSKVHKCGFRRLNDKRGNPWTDEQTATLVRMWSENRATPAIEVATGHSATAVFNKAHDLGLGARNFGRKIFTEIPKIEKPWPDESVAAKLRELATARFLIDFKRGGYTAKHYRRHCEVHPSIVATEPCLRDNETPLPKLADYQTYMGSTAAMCAEMSQ